MSRRGSEDTYLTSIARVPVEVAVRVEPALDRLRARAPRHHYYTRETMHVTIRNLDALRGGDLTAARAVIEAHPPFELNARGLGVSRRTVFAVVRSPDGGLASLRRALDGLTGESSRFAGFGHLNVVRFSGWVGALFVRELVRVRRIELGSWVVREVELVRTDRLLSVAGTEVLERVRLGA